MTAPNVQNGYHTQSSHRIAVTWPPTNSGQSTVSPNDDISYLVKVAEPTIDAAPWFLAHRISSLISTYKTSQKVNHLGF